MRAWPAPEVPDLREQFGDGPVVRAFDTATGNVEAIEPRSRTARIYVCGITPYDATHLGHAATYLAYDLLQRAWLDHGLDVNYVQNVTDVDDPLLERAALTGADWTDLAETETQNFRIDMESLRLLPPAQYVGVVEALDQIIEHIRRLERAGATYLVDNDLYFDITQASNFGETLRVDPQDMLALFAEHGGDPQRVGKRNALDSLLWLGARDGEPRWESPWGPGRPGWHVECTAIALDQLGAGFDVQGGGADLAFPHHEMVAAEAWCAGFSYARHHVHASMVGYQGEKMSKSRGNLVMVNELRASGHEPAAIRLALLGRHYRSQWEWTSGDIDAAEVRLAAWRAGVVREVAPPAEPVVRALRAALTNDLDAPAALAVVDEWVRSEGSEEGSGATVAEAIDALLGVALGE